jgi:hypothetical protein
MIGTLRFAAFLLTALLTSTVHAQAPAETLPDAEAAAGRLDAIFAKQAGQGEFGRYLHGVSGIAIGGTSVTYGAYLMVEETAWENQDLQLLTGGLLLGLGTVILTSSIYTLATPSFGTERYERFRLAYADGLSEREVGQFEGELRLDAERARFGRRMHVVTGFAKLIGGGAIMVATAAAQTSQDQEHFGYALGGVIAGLGLLTAFKSMFCRSHAERAWDDYLNGEVPEARAGLQIDVAPAVGPETAGLSVFGSF